MFLLEICDINLFLNHGSFMVVLRFQTYPDRSASKFRFWGWSECFWIFDLDPVSSENDAPQTWPSCPPNLGTEFGAWLGTKLDPKLGTKLGTRLGSKLDTKLGTRLGTKLGTKTPAEGVNILKFRENLWRG